MSAADDGHDDLELRRLLAGAAKTVKRARYCWLATNDAAGGGKLRPMGRLPNDAGEDEWMIRFLTDGRSHKASDLRRDSKVTIIFQHDPDEAYVSLIGAVSLGESASEVRAHWKDAYDVYFPTEQDRANAIFVEVEVQRMELWIRGVTAEPFGMRTTVLERDAGSRWRLISG